MSEKNKLLNFLFLIKYLVISIVFLHFFGIFGIIIAFFYPLWWFFRPDKTFCLFCLHEYLIKKNQSYCLVCKRKTSNIYAPPLYSTLVNTLTILTISVFAFFLICLEIKILSEHNININNFLISKKANFSLPKRYNFYLGKEFSFDIKINNPEKPINVVQADIYFDKDLIQVSSINTENSFATIFTQKDFSNNEGWIRIVGGIPNPGFIGEEGLFARINFKPVKQGAGKISFLPSSKILSNDGKGSNILAKFPSQSFIIEEEKEVLGETTQKTILNKIINYFSLLFK